MVCLRFAKAEALLQNEKTSNPGNQVPYLLEQYIDFLKITVNEDNNDFTRLKQNLEPRLQKLSSGNSGSPWYLYSQATVQMLSGLAKAKFGEFIGAGLDISAAYRLLLENMKAYPSFAPAKLQLGLLHTIIGSIPPQYRWAARTLNFKGSIEQGNLEIREAFRSIVSDPDLDFMVPEAAFIQSFVTLNLTADQSAALAFAEQLNKPPYNAMVSESPLITYALANVYYKTGRNEKLKNVLSNLHYSANQSRYYFLDYLLGVAKMNCLDKEAIYPLLNFVGSFKGKNHIRSAYMYIAWYYAINGDMAKYDIYIKRIAQRGSGQVDIDRDAMMIASLKRKPDLPLIKARLLCDGGFYDRALSELNGYKPYDELSNLEFTYRTGRIYDRRGQPETAIPYYLSAIQKGEKLPYYFAANAALQTGLIYEKSEKYNLAKTFYERVLSMDFEEYQFSICNKAQAGLNRMKSKIGSKK